MRRVTLILLSALVAMSISCGKTSDDAVSNERQPRISIPIPQEFALIGAYTLEAELVVNGVPYPMICDQGANVATLANIALLPGTYDVTLNFFVMAGLTKVIVATATKQANISANQTASLDFLAADFDTSIDGDTDNVSNYNEVALGSDPTDAASIPTEACANGQDDDADGRIDYDLDPLVGDPGCSAPGDMTEEQECNDGVDNDGDTVIDFAGGDNGCASVLDIVELSSPLISGTMPDTVSDVAVSGNYAFALSYSAFALGKDIITIDVADPSAPSTVNTYSTSTTLSHIVIDGLYAYVAATTGGLLIIDISNPLSPTSAGSCAITAPAVANDVFIRFPYAYIAAGSGGLEICDVSNPATATIVGSAIAGDAVAVFVDGNYAYIAARQYGLRIMDITNPLSPTEVGKAADGGTSYIDGVVAKGNYAYVSSQVDLNGDGSIPAAEIGLHTVDVTDPSAPQFVHFNGLYVSGPPVLAGNYVYYTSYNGSTHIYSISNPAAPASTFTFSICQNHSGYINHDGGYLYVGCRDFGFEIYNIDL